MLLPPALDALLRSLLLLRRVHPVGSARQNGVAFGMRPVVGDPVDDAMPRAAKLVQIHLSQWGPTAPAPSDAISNLRDGSARVGAKCFLDRIAHRGCEGIRGGAIMRESAI
jgi:hypothetical protein